MKALVSHLEFEFKSLFRDSTQLLMNYLFPLAFFLIMAMIMPNINKDFKNFLLPSMIVFAVMASTLLSLPGIIVTSKENGIFRSFKIYGVSLKNALIVPVITMTIHMIIVSLIISLLAIYVFKATVPSNILLFISSYLLILLAFTGLGTLIGVISPNSRISVLFGQLLFLPSMMLSGITIPTNTLSGSIQRIARVFPGTHGINLFGSLCYNKMPLIESYISSLLLLIGGILAFILAAFLFNWDIKSSKGWKLCLAFLALVPYIISIFI